MTWVLSPANAGGGNVQKNHSDTEMQIVTGVAPRGKTSGRGRSEGSDRNWWIALRQSVSDARQEKEETNTQGNVNQGKNTAAGLERKHSPCFPHVHRGGGVLVPGRFKEVLWAPMVKPGLHPEGQSLLPECHTFLLLSCQLVPPPWWTIAFRQWFSTFGSRFLWGSNDPFIGVAYQISYIFIIIYNSIKITVRK